MLLRHYIENLDYADLGVHAVLLADHVRVDAYRRAITSAVQPGMRVVDVGAGTGVLGRLAAQAGASVVMVEREKSLCTHMRLLNALLTPSADIDVVCAKIEDITLSPCDVVIHELIGGRLFDEGMARALRAFAQRNAWYESSVIMPARTTLWCRFVNVPATAFAGTLPAWTELDRNSHFVEVQEGTDQRSLIWATSSEDFEPASEWYAVGEFDLHLVSSWRQSFLVEDIEVCRPANAVLWGVTAALSDQVVLDLRLGNADPTSWGGTVEQLPHAKSLSAAKYRVTGTWSNNAKREPRWIRTIQQMKCHRTTDTSLLSSTHT